MGDIAMNLFLPAVDRALPLWRYSDPRWFTVLSDSPAAVEESGLRVELPRPSPFVEVMSPEEASQLLGSIVPASHGPIETLVAAKQTGAVVLRVKQGAPFVELRAHLSSQSFAATRLFVLIEKGANARLVEEHHGEPGSLGLRTTELILEDGATAEHLAIGLWSSDATAHLTFRARLAQKASYRAAFVTLGGEHVKLDVGASLCGEGARSDVAGLALGQAQQRFDHHTVHVHSAPRTTSNLSFRAALLDRSRSAYTGLIRMEKEAAASEAYQESRNLLLSPLAHADSIPQLEILTNDVRCTHGATTAPLDEAQLYYLRSRGLSRAVAEGLLVRGFFEDTLSRLPPDLRGRVDALVEARIEGMP